MRTGNIRVVIFILWIGGTIWMRKLKISIVFLRRWRGREWIFWKFVHFANRTSHKGVRLLSVGNLFRVRIDDNTLGATGSRGLVTLQRTLLNWHATWSFLVKTLRVPTPFPSDQSTIGLSLYSLYFLKSRAQTRAFTMPARTLLAFLAGHTNFREYTTTPLAFYSKQARCKNMLTCFWSIWEHLVIFVTQIT